MFKSRRYEGVTHSRMMLGVARAKHYLGPYEVAGKEPVFSADAGGAHGDATLLAALDRTLTGMGGRLLENRKRANPANGCQSRPSP